MYHPIQLTIRIPSVITSISRAPLRRGFVLMALTLACFALSPPARAVDPPPDGGYPNGNTAEGHGALFSLTTGRFNTAIGFEALYSNTTGGFNTANGFKALQFNTTGFSNTANGYKALRNNTNGAFNTANGVLALLSNTTGISNTANGYNALRNNTNGAFNTANGVLALLRNTTGISNTADGLDALFSNTTGNLNTANGVLALSSNTTGSNNTATGQESLASNTTGGNNIALGFNAGFNLTTGNNNVDIGNAGVAEESNKIRIGTKGTHKNTFIAGISGATVAGGVGVIIDANGHLGTVTSSERFKEAIKPMDKASEAILALKPVTFRYKHELDPEGIAQFGLVAEQVEKVNPDLVARDDQGKVYTVRYEAVNAMLLNEFLKEHRKVEKQETAITQLKSTVAKQETAIAQQQKEFRSIVAQQQKDFQSTVARQQKQIEALNAGLQQVSDAIQPSKKTAQLVAENQ